MTVKDIADIATYLIGGLAIFLLGMKHMSEGMQAIAGTRLRKMISAVTDNRLVACGVGAGVTSLIQSSSVTTVIVVGLVNAGFMTLLQAIGVILGADLGTTITAWIVSMNVIEYGLPILGISGFVYLFSKNERVRYTAMTIMGVGMVFFGLYLMKDGLAPIKQSDAIRAALIKFEPTGYVTLLKCVLIGALTTAIVQSSSATIAMTIILARSGVIGYNTAVALVLGENIGTTITAYLASLGASTSAKRVAYAHILIKIVAVGVMVPFFFIYLRFLNNLVSSNVDIAKRIALSHSMFNLILVCLFLPLTHSLARFLKWVVPDKAHKEAPHLTFLDVRLLDTPAFGIQQSSDEIIKMREGVGKMMTWLRELIAQEEPDEQLEQKLFHREEILDIMQKEIVEFLGSLLSGSVPRDVMDQARCQLRITDEYESISDYAAGILKLKLKMRNLGAAFSSEGKQELLNLHDKVAEYINMVSDAFADGNSDILSKAYSHGDTITHMMKDARHSHVTMVETKRVLPLTSLVFVDMLQSYRKIKDHALNIAEAIAGQK